MIEIKTICITLRKISKRYNYNFNYILINRLCRSIILNVELIC